MLNNKVKAALSKIVDLEKRFDIFIPHMSVFPNGLILMSSLELECSESEWKTWEMLLKAVTTRNQYNLCAVCGEPVIGHQHHALVSRNDVRGIKGQKKNQILHHSYNVLVVHEGNCHDNCQRDFALQYLSDLWGKQNIIEWHNNLPFKSTFRRIG